MRLRVGDKFKCKTVLGTECVFMYLGSTVYYEYGKEYRMYYTKLRKSSKGNTGMIREWKGGFDSPRNYYKDFELVEQNPVQYEASKRMAKKYLNKYLGEKENG